MTQSPYYYFIDPGESTGWAKFNAQGEAIDIGQVKGFDNWCQWLRVHVNLETAMEINKIVAEKFTLYPWKSNSQMWSEFETVQVLGHLRGKCVDLAIPYETVPAKDYAMGFRYQGMDVPSHSNPLHDQLVAHAHGVFYLQSRGIRKPMER